MDVASGFSRLPLGLPAAPISLFALNDGGIIAAFADHPPMLIREQFGTLLGFIIEPAQA